MGCNTKKCGVCGTVFDRGTGLSERKCPTCIIDRLADQDKMKLEKEVAELAVRLGRIELILKDNNLTSRF
jgi:hypothetical protein